LTFDSKCAKIPSEPPQGELRLERNERRYEVMNPYFLNIIHDMFDVEKLKEHSDGKKIAILRKKPNPEEMALLGLVGVG
jgi:hypothetical protein